MTDEMIYKRDLDAFESTYKRDRRERALRDACMLLRGVIYGGSIFLILIILNIVLDEMWRSVLLVGKMPFNL